MHEVPEQIVVLEHRHIIWEEFVRGFEDSVEAATNSLRAQVGK